MRVDFVKAVHPLITQDPSSVFITGDLGYAALEGLRDELGARFLNAGVAEQNMIGVAAGMALTGLRPWVYSIAPFVTYRCLEQIRNDVCLHALPVRLVGNGGGYTYGIMGSTHHALEDMAVLKSLPNMSLYFPCSNDHVAAAVSQIQGISNPSYLRLAISPYTTALKPISENPTTLTRRYSTGNQVTVIGVGHAVQLALKTLSEGQLGGGEVSVFGVARFPLDLERDAELRQCVANSRKVIVIEEHYEYGGISETLKSKLPNTDSFQIMAPFYSKDQRYGSAAFHLKQCGITPENLVSAVQAMIKPSKLRQVA